MSVLGLIDGIQRCGREGASPKMRDGWWDVQVERGKRQGEMDSKVGHIRDKRMETSL